MEIYVEDDSSVEEEFRFHTVGEKLKAERERLGLSLSDLAASTRVPMRHLDSIEKSEFSNLPGTTYTLGFTRSYARAVQLDAAAFSTRCGPNWLKAGMRAIKRRPKISNLPTRLGCLRGHSHGQRLLLVCCLLRPISSGGA